MYVSHISSETMQIVTSLERHIFCDNNVAGKESVALQYMCKYIVHRSCYLDPCDTFISM